MRIRHEPGIEIKTAAQLAAMAEAGQAVARALRAAAGAVAPGISTADLDAVAAGEIRAAGASPSFLGYHGFPATICVCLNDEIVHGIPDPARRLRDGDLVSIDCGAIVRGWHADAAFTVPVGTVSTGVSALLDACELALWHGLAAARPGARLGDISHAVERYARSAGDYGIVEDYGGHGIGSEMHMDPAVPNHGAPGRGPLLAEGMALAIEPLLVLGSPGTRLLDDGWTVVSEDGSLSAHFEHTVAITADGPWVLTAADGGAAGFARLAGPRRQPARPDSGSRELARSNS
jgi:methionyl aminopeptidase